jgi:hypothetical protein
MKVSFITIVLFITSQIFAQCYVQKTGSQYGFFRVTNFKEKVCWISEPFAYKIANNNITNYDEMLACFMKKVLDLGGNIVHDTSEFGTEQVLWLNNTYNGEDNFSYNWSLPSEKACKKYISDEIIYKTNNGIKVNIIRMFSDGLINNNEFYK